MDPAASALWFAGKQMLPDKKVSDFLGRHEKTKAVVKLTRKGQGAPAREPVRDGRTTPTPVGDGSDGVRACAVRLLISMLRALASAAHIHTRTHAHAHAHTQARTGARTSVT